MPKDGDSTNTQGTCPSAAPVSCWKKLFLHVLLKFYFLEFASFTSCSFSLHLLEKLGFFPLAPHLIAEVRNLITCSNIPYLIQLEQKKRMNTTKRIFHVKMFTDIFECRPNSPNARDFIRMSLSPSLITLGNTCKRVEFSCLLF